MTNVTPNKPGSMSPEPLPVLLKSTKNLSLNRADKKMSTCLKQSFYVPSINFSTANNTSNLNNKFLNFLNNFVKQK